MIGFHVASVHSIFVPSAIVDSGHAYGGTGLPTRSAASNMRRTTEGGGNLRAFLWAIVICVTVPLTVHLTKVGAISTEGKATGYLAGLLYDFQTLFAGVLAIIAAYLTMGEMRRTDERSDKRHKETMDLAIRADRLKVQRALHPQFIELNLIRKKFRTLNVYVAEVEKAARDRATNSLQWQYSKLEIETIITGVYPLISDLRDIIARPQFIDGAQLFDGELTYMLTQITKHINDAYVRGAGVYSYHCMQENERSRDDYLGYMKAVANGDDAIVMRFPQHFTQHAMPLLDGMSRMAKMYGVREDWSPEPDK